jgi:hypothetical protein
MLLCMLATLSIVVLMSKYCDTGISMPVNLSTMLDIVNESVMLLKKLANLDATGFIDMYWFMYIVRDCNLLVNAFNPMFCVIVLVMDASLETESLIPNESAIDLI